MNNTKVTTASAQVQVSVGDPHVHAVAQQLGADRDRVREPHVGGRPPAYPDWALVIFGAAIRVFGSASAVGRELADPQVWQLVLRARLGSSAAGTPVPVGLPRLFRWRWITRSSTTAQRR
jgi:hypothetical protein